MAKKKYSLRDVFIKWLYSLNVDVDFNKSDPVDIIDYYILNKPLRNDKLSKEEKAELKANARLEGEELFSRFLNEVITFEDQQKLDFTWNRIYNGHSEVNHARIPIAFECSAYFKSGILRITSNQREGVAFQELVGAGINAFDVGVGKTMTAIANLAMNIFNGKAERPLVVVPKPTYEKWINEIAGYKDRKSGQFVPGFLSGTGIKVNVWENLGTNVLKKIDLTKAVPKGSITVVTYEGFKRIGFGDSVTDELFSELVNILGQSNVSTGSRDPELDYQKYRQMIGVGLKNTVADIDELGFDYLVVDEAHRAKNVFDNIKKDEDGNKRYLMQGAQSETGIKTFFITNYLQRKFGRNVMFLTATPFTNSPLEIFSMLSHVAYEDLQSMGINNIDTFFDLFVIPTVEWTANYKEEIVEKEVIKSFTNRLILNRLIYNHILYKTGEEAGVTRPTKINIPYLYKTEKGKTVRLSKKDQVLTYLNMNRIQRSNQLSIVSMAQSATTGRVNKGQLFRALNKSLDNALSPYLVSGTPENYKEFVDNSPKITYAMECIRSVKQWHEKRGEPCSGQVIYMNRGKAFFGFIREYLEKELGFKRNVKYGKYQFNEVEVISSEISETKKERIKEAFLENVVKVIIGTSTIREGIDLQKNGTVLYNLYPDWNPTDIRQLEGRIWRQGNRYKYVRSVMPLVADSMDVFIFQKLEEKTARINDIWAKGNRKNVLDVESLDPAEIKLALITDVSRLVKMFFDQEKEELNRELRRVNSYLKTITDIKYDIERYQNLQDKMHDYLLSHESHFKMHSWFINPDNYDKPLIKKAKAMLDDMQRYNRSSSKSDKEGMSLVKRYVNLVNTYMPYWLTSLKEVISTVRKAERNILQPRGFTIESNLEDVQADVNKDRIAIFRKAGRLFPAGTFSDNASNEDYEKFFSSFPHLTEEGMRNSPRWNELLKEVAIKKSALNVSGKSPLERAKEFAGMNHLLAEKREEKAKVAVKVKKPVDEKPDIKLMEAEAEAELLLLELLEL
jgi:superfamily II DNA/RNA helicase